MDLNNLLNITAPLTANSINFDVLLPSMNNSGKTYYDTLVNQNVLNQIGIYVILQPLEDSIIYIGKGGTLKTDGTYKNQKVNGRLKAPRGNYNNSFEYFKQFMNVNNHQILRFYIFYSNQNIPPAYLEALVLYNFYNINNCLPVLNYEF
jgi:hypothetical protein